MLKIYPKRENNTHLQSKAVIIALDFQQASKF